MLGMLILLINVAMFAKMDIVSGTEMPILEIAKNIHPLLGFLMAFALLGMIYNTAVGLLYSFIIRFIPPKDPIYKPSVILIGAIGFMASFVGFTTLVGKVYSLMGYLGFALILAILFQGRVKSSVLNVLNTSLKLWQPDYLEWYFSLLLNIK